ncbi:MAG TPA: TetR family transcriptional regulator [Ornithinimicrobium sp.]|uniref:TetR/AcrR family transcriptional regulator n=1 Tax=Ornithinimicrobium sp. TaxID=1977084 RepID=UPI002B46B0FE|nr:TetR family transcriptional regulator [Ornithinimicrobium sp.]HKJ13206.1 TetR family transcriptional regulator [Ornithinimicrobium sp.]
MRHTAAADTARRYLPAGVRRQQILEAAAALAIRDGLESTTIAGVAAEAGVAKGAIYLHFASRGQLIAGLQALVWAQMMEQPRVVAHDAAVPWAERLDAVVAHWMRFELENQSLYHAVFHTVPTESDEPLMETREVLSDLLTGGVAADEFDLRGIDTATAVEFLLHAYVGPCFHTGHDQGRVITDVQRLFRRAVGARDSAVVEDG